MLLLLTLTGCDGVGAGGSGFAEDYAGREGVFLELGPLENPSDTPLILHIEAGEWLLKLGDEWAAAQVLATYPYDLQNGLHVGDTHLLPAELSVGATGAGVEVTARGTAETYYGIFEDTYTVEVSGGPWAGEQVFARDLGPVRITHDGEARELAYYQ